MRKVSTRRCCDALGGRGCVLDSGSAASSLGVPHTPKLLCAALRPFLLPVEIHISSSKGFCEDVILQQQTGPRKGFLPSAVSSPTAIASRLLCLVTRRLLVCADQHTFRHSAATRGSSNSFLCSVVTRPLSVFCSPTLLQECGEAPLSLTALCVNACVGLCSPHVQHFQRIWPLIFLFLPPPLVPSSSHAA